MKTWESIGTYEDKYKVTDELQDKDLKQDSENKVLKSCLQKEKIAF